MNPLGSMLVGNLLHRPLRTLITVVAVGVEVCLVVIIVGLTTGLLHETAKRIEGVGADLMLQPPAASILQSFSGAPMPVKIKDKLEAIPHVAAVAPVLLQFHTSGLSVVYGIELKSFEAVSNGFVYHAGGPFQEANDLLVDDWCAPLPCSTTPRTTRLPSSTSAATPRRTPSSWRKRSANSFPGTS